LTTPQNIFNLCLVGVLFLIVYFFIPFWIMGFRFHKGNAIDNLVKAFLVSNIVTMSLVYFLAIVGIYNLFTFLLMLVLIYIGYVYFISRESFVKKTNNLLTNFSGMHDGIFSFSIFYKRWKNEIIRKFFTNIKRFFKHPVNLIIFTFAMVFASTYRCYHSVFQAQFGTSDIYVHTNWIKLLDNNQIFLDGVYPYGYHIIVSVLAKLTGMNVVVIMRFIGGIVGILICAFLYYACRRVFKSAFVANCAVIFYTVTSFAGGFWRQQFALPQEYGMLFLYPCGYFLHRFMVHKKRSDLTYFGIALSLTISAHFYVTILAALLCIGIFVANYWEIFKKKVFVSLVIAVSLSLAAAVVPLLMGRAIGMEWHGSMGWALGIMSSEGSDEASSASAGQLPPDPNAPEGSGSTTPSQSEEKEMPTTFEEFRIEAEGYVGQITSMRWFTICLYATLFILIYSFVKVLIFRKNPQNRLALGFSIYTLLLFVVIFAPIRGFPMIMDFARSGIFYGYIAPIMIAGPLQVLYDIFHRKNFFMRMVHVVIIVVLGSYFANYVVDGKHYVAKPSAFREQLTSAVEVYYDIAKYYPKNKWTIVSPVDETSMVRGRGYHYELKDFILQMDNYTPDTKIYIPTKYVFVYVEKRPIVFNDIIYYENGFPKPTDMVTLDEAHTALDAFGETAMYNPLFFYANYVPRRVLEAKTYYWAQEYMKYFPKEMKVYYESSEFIVYKITQNEYALNNFAISYEGNIPEKQNHKPIYLDND